MTTTRPIRMALALLATLIFAALAAAPARGQTAARIGDLTHHTGDVPRRLAGYGLVVGLDGTGDRSFGGSRGETPTVRSIINLLRRFHVEVPADRLRPRDVAAVLVTAEVSPYQKAGGRFEIQIGAIGDATSIRGGQLWITPLVSDPNEPPVATAQGALLVAGDPTRSATAARANSGRVPQGGLLEIDPPAMPPPDTRLQLREADLGVASRIADAVNLVFGPNTARVEDPGTVALQPSGASAANPLAFLAAVDTVRVFIPTQSRVVLDARDGTVVAGGEVRVGSAVVSHRGVTLQVAPRSGARTAADGLVRLDAPATIHDVAAGLHAAGLRPDEMASIFQALRAAGALEAEIVVR
ncbi:MAG: flagellar basal body P-ring protein FlgI [Candidatus Eisenbacteria bacterium]